MSQTPYTYCFVRKDIPVAYQIVQACHACLERGLTLEQDKKPKETSFLILFEVKDEKALLKVAQYLDENSVSYEKFFEPDYDTGYTALATEPVYGEGRNLFKRFKLWKP